MSSRKHLITHLHHLAYLRNGAGLRSLAHYISALPSSDDAVQILQLLFADQWQPLKTACTSHKGDPAPAHLLSRYRRDDHAPASSADHREFLAPRRVRPAAHCGPGAHPHPVIRRRHAD